ncbi:MAG: hydrogenase formation protein HypD, partial [Enterococcus sp.]|nr:hydrogenase formation protein HypD [Enterococcus sp.]
MDFSKFSDIEQAKNLISQISFLAPRTLRLMEVCGTHTFQIAKLGLRDALSEKIKFLSGPGCPVCVSSVRDIDKIIQLSKIPNTIICSFGDMIRVPGSCSSLAHERTNGADIRVIYSPLDSLKIAQENPRKKIILIGIGFETTTPLIASTLSRARNLKIKNFSVFSINKNMPNALRLLLQDEDLNIDGLLLPGHVSTIIGLEAYDFIADEFKIPACVAGFELIDILQAVVMLSKQIVQNTPKIENSYRRAVKYEGNPQARDLINQVF